MSVLPLSFLTPSRCVLLISDDSLYVYNTGANRVRLVDSVAWETPQFVQVVSDLIRREAAGRTVMIVNDMTDQLFKGGQRIPKVGSFDKASVVSRKLAAAFPNYPIRGALALKENGPRRPSAVEARTGGGLYLFAAVPVSDPVQKTLNAVKMSLASISGFALLPVETSDMVRALSEKVNKRQKVKPRWAVLIGQHHSGGLRQVITRDGQLAMTRMTPVIDLAQDPDSWAREVAQEFKATISYLSRFGYSPNDGTDVFVIATPEAGQMLEQRIDIPCNLMHYTVGAAARELGFSIGIQENQYFADPLHASWIGRKTRLTLPMDAADIQKIYAPRQAATVGMVLLLASAAYLSWQLFGASQAWMATQEDIARQQRIQVSVKEEYNVELARMEKIGLDVRLIKAALETYQGLERDGLHPLPIIRKVGEALGSELRLDGLVLERVAPTLPSDPYALEVLSAEEKAPKLRADLSIRFPATINTQVAMREVNSLRGRLRNLLPGYEVVVSRPIGDLVYEDVQGGRGAFGQALNSGSEDHVAVLVITGPVQYSPPKVEIGTDVPSSPPGENVPNVEDAGEVNGNENQPVEQNVEPSDAEGLPQ